MPSNVQMVTIVQKMTSLYQSRRLLLAILLLAAIFTFFTTTTQPARKGEDFPPTVKSSRSDLRKEAGNLTPRQLCGCSADGLQENLSSNDDDKVKPQSTCSDEATLTGPNQNVVSFVYYEGDLSSGQKREVWTVKNFIGGILGNIETVRQFYPNWLIRLYSNISLDVASTGFSQNDGILKNGNKNVTHLSRESLCDLICKNTKDFYFCPIQNLKEYPNLHREHPMLWRFLPLGDPTVERFLVRDLDLRITQREADAVHEWEESPFPFHGMRDHPYHCVPMLGGLWGGNNEKIGADRALHIQKMLMRHRKNGCCGIDQQALATHIHRPFYKDILSHDSYCCSQFSDSVPFPTRRVMVSEFVGGLDPGETKAVAECPANCRPKYGKDWIYC